MIACRRWRCPACGTFGRRARRRAERAADQLHVNWARHLAVAARSRRATSGVRVMTMTPESAAFLAQHYGPKPEPDMFELAAQGRKFLSDLRSMKAFDVPESQPGQRFGSMLEQYRAMQDKALEEYNTADVAAEVVGDLTYEEQSEMIGDPIADVIRRETE